MHNLHLFQIIWQIYTNYWLYKLAMNQRMMRMRKNWNSRKKKSIFLSNYCVHYEHLLINSLDNIQYYIVANHLYHVRNRTPTPAFIMRELFIKSELWVQLLEQKGIEHEIYLNVWSCCCNFCFVFFIVFYGILAFWSLSTTARWMAFIEAYFIYV